MGICVLLIIDWDEGLKALSGISPHGIRMHGACTIYGMGCTFD
jgi:hypothetical protein